MNTPHEAAMEQQSSLIPVVGVGASAGGVDALERFCRFTPSETGIAFIVAVHQSVSQLAGRFSRTALIKTS